MRTFVQNALVVLHDQEHDELHALVLEASREATARLLARAEENLNRHDPFGEERRAAATRGQEAHGRPAPDQTRGARPAVRRDEARARRALRRQDHPAPPAAPAGPAAAGPPAAA